VIGAACDDERDTVSGEDVRREGFFTSESASGLVQEQLSEAFHNCSIHTQTPYLGSQPMFRRDYTSFHPLHTPPPFSQLLPAISSNTVKMLIG